MGKGRANKIFFFSVVLAAFLVTFRPLVLLAGQSAETEKDYLIGVGDVLEIQVWREPDLSRTLTVRLDGKITLPLAGDVEVVGKTTSDLDKFLEKHFADLVTEPSVSVILLESRRRYYVIGQIAEAGEFSLDSALTIVQAIARSGGFLEWAKRDDIKVVRRTHGRDELLPFNSVTFFNGKNLDQNILIAPGDTIIVP